MLAAYFEKPRTLFRAAGADTTPQQIADKGEKIIFGGIGQSKVPGAIGKGQCPLCH
jgi:hypothetical protein